MNVLTDTHYWQNSRVEMEKRFEKHIFTQLRQQIMPQKKDMVANTQNMKRSTALWFAQKKSNF